MTDVGDIMLVNNVTLLEKEKSFLSFCKKVHFEKVLSKGCVVLCLTELYEINRERYTKCWFLSSIKRSVCHFLSWFTKKVSAKIFIFNLKYFYLHFFVCWKTMKPVCRFRLQRNGSFSFKTVLAIITCTFTTLSSQTDFANQSFHITLFSNVGKKIWKSKPPKQN